MWRQLLRFLGQCFEPHCFKLVALEPAWHLVRIGDRESDPKAEYRVIDHAVKIPAVVIFVSWLVIINVGVVINLLPAPFR